MTTTWHTSETPRTETLRETDRRYRALNDLSHFLWLLWFAAMGCVVLAAVMLVDSNTVGVGRADAVLSAAGVAVGAAAGLGGIAVTLFFVTAQLRVAGVSRRGLIELYRVRLLVPLVVSTGSIIVAGSAAILLPSPQDQPGRTLAVFAILGLLPFLIAVVQLSTLSLVYFEPISIAQQFANALNYKDVDEWQLLDLRVGTQQGCDRLLVQCTLKSNRMNFGLRDPLMPIQELVEHARNKELGRLEAVLMNRVSEEYEVPWTQQAPDPNRWGEEGGLGRRERAVRAWRRFKRRSSKRGLDSLEPARRRLALVLLIVHYFRRLPANRAIAEIPADVRRQQTQFLLCRLAFVLAKESPMSAAAVNSPELERRTALVLVVYAIAGLSAFFRNCPSRNKIEPPWALTATAVALRSRGWIDEYTLVIDTLAWLKTATPHIDDSWAASQSAEQVSADREQVYADIARRLPYEGEHYPVLGDVQDPWRDLRDGLFTDPSKE